MKTLQDFTGIYPVSKTLRFELVPQGKTLDHIEKEGFISKDEDRANKYKQVKKIIDNYHKDFIERALHDVQLTHLDEYYFQYSLPKEQQNEDIFKKIKEALRKEIVAAFKKDPLKAQFDNLFKKELIKEDLKKYVNKDEIELISEFEKFTTYFTGFHENRKNMYSAEEKSTAIAFRIIHENLPKFIDNIRIYENIKSNYKELDLTPILSEMEDVIQGKTLDEIFDLNYFNEVLSENGIEFINAIIGGRSEKSGEKKIKGLNEYINLYNQQQRDKRKRVPKFKQLYKQILSDRGSISWIAEGFETDSEVLDAINSFYKEHIENALIDGKEENLLTKIEDALKSLAILDLTKVYIRNDGIITSISQAIFGDYSILGRALGYYYQTVIDPQWDVKYAKANEEKREKLERIKNRFTKSTYIPIATAQNALERYILTLDAESAIRHQYTPTSIIDYFVNHFYAKDENGNKTKNKLTYQVTSEYNGIKGLLNIKPADNYKLIQDKDRVHQLKTFLDSIMNLLHFIKPLYVEKNASEEKNELFYTEFTPVYDELAKIVPLYNKTRNHLTQKPYSTEKFKLNFENSTLLDGWDVNKEQDNSCILLLKDGIYYLGVMDKKNNKSFKKTPKPTDNQSVYKKMNYKLLPGANKMLPKVFFSKSRIKEFNVPEEILDNYKANTHTKGENFSLSDCHKLTDFFKSAIQKHEDWKHFDFTFSNTNEYEDISGFYREVEQKGYKITFSDVPEQYINQLVDEGKLYLFKIHNKDFSTSSKGKPNLHTLYWKALFTPENLADIVYKLNGQAEIFFRKSSIDPQKAVIHNARENLLNKNPLASKKTSVFDYDIIKDRRYTVDKFQFHVPITMNFKATRTDYINPDVNEFLRNNPDVKIIGLDRGERHLIYLTLIDQQGNIILQESLNTIYDEKHNIKTSYHQLLDKKEEERDKARKSWDTIETIKELKEGYISQIVHRISQMMVEHQAIVVLEDLNMGFKQGRFKVEKQVYQKLEKMLIDKLNYLVLKEKEDMQAGGLYKALQLTNKFSSFKDLGKQTGFLFYVPAWNTSRIDPMTGFVDFLKPKYDSIEQTKAFLEKFKDIRFNPEKHYVEFAFDYKDFTTKADDTRTVWTICSHGERIETFRNPNKVNQWDSREVVLTQAFEELFARYNIDYKSSKQLKSALLRQTEKSFFEQLMHLLRLTLQMRNSKTGTDIDYLISPVTDKDGNFFDSRTYANIINPAMPKDADANGAYHIALKGLWILKKGLYNLNKKGNPELGIKNKEWLQFVQELRK